VTKLLTCKAEFEYPLLLEGASGQVTDFTRFEFNKHSKFNHFPPHHHLPSPPENNGGRDNGYNNQPPPAATKAEGKEKVPTGEYPPANHNH
jgi:hypothetical protein